jgi:surface polysaccharide O-acyltransferase-like enzyme
MTTTLIPDHPKTKVVYIDHIKVGLTALVIIHHALVTYGAPGGWYYSEKSTLKAALIPMTAFVAVNQAFFMGFFFFLSALFVPLSYDKKGPLKFVADRLLRLGLPLIFYSFILSPFLSFMVFYFAEGHHITYLQYLGGYDNWIEFGVLWFVAALLIFNLLYVLFRLILKSTAGVKPLPSVSRILLFAIFIGVISYGVRVVFPVGWVLKPLGFQLGHFPQYIAMFIAGLVASRSKWLNTAEYKTGRQMRLIACLLVFIGFPLFFVVQVLLKFPVTYFNVGGHWQSLWYAVWEQLVGFTIVTALLCIGKHRWNRPSDLLAKLSRSAFAVYIFHPLVLIALSLVVRTWAVDPAVKLLIVAPLAVAGTFLLGLVLVKIPGLNKII